MKFETSIIHLNGSYYVRLDPAHVKFWKLKPRKGQRAVFKQDDLYDGEVFIIEKKED